MFVPKRWLAILLFLLIISAPARSQQATSAEEVTLEQAIALALKENRQVKVAALELDKFADRLAVAKTHRLPHFDFSVLAVELIKKIDFDVKKGDFGTLTGVGPVPETDVTVTAPRRPAFYFNGGVFQPLSQAIPVEFG